MFLKTKQATCKLQPTGINPDGCSHFPEKESVNCKLLKLKYEQLLTGISLFLTALK